MKIIAKVLILVSLFSVLGACMKKPEFPVQPVIKFVEFKRFGNDSAHFVFSFTDGDGDIGLKSSDTLPPFNQSGDYYYNFIMDYWEKKNGQWEKIELLVPFAYRIPELTPQGKARALEGEVVVRIPFIYYDFTSPFDTLKFSAFIYDRALNKSNEIETNEMVK